MKSLLAGVMLALTIMPAAAETQHDRKLEQAVMDIVAAKMGDLRGALPWTMAMAIVSNDGMTTASVGLSGLANLEISGWNNGLAVARERRISAIVLN